MCKEQTILQKSDLHEAPPEWEFHMDNSLYLTLSFLKVVKITGDMMHTVNTVTMDTCKSKDTHLELV